MSVHFTYVLTEQVKHYHRYHGAVGDMGASHKQKRESELYE
jgi:hypothetical protein